MNYKNFFHLFILFFPEQVEPCETSELLPVYNRTSSQRYHSSIPISDWSDVHHASGLHGSNQSQPNRLYSTHKPTLQKRGFSTHQQPTAEKWGFSTNQQTAVQKHGFSTSQEIAAEKCSFINVFRGGICVLKTKDNSEKRMISTEH